MAEEYISLDAAIAAFSTNGSVFVYGQNVCKAIISRLKLIPPAKVRPVVYSRWIYDCERTAGDGWTYRQYHCEKCGNQLLGGLHNYCPDCGADMREDGNG